MVAIQRLKAVTAPRVNQPTRKNEPVGGFRHPVGATATAPATSVNNVLQHPTGFSATRQG